MHVQATHDPAAFPHVFKANFDAKRIEAIVAGYGEDGVLDLGGGNVFRGHDQIRVAIANFLASALPITVTPVRTLETGDQAVVLFNWSIRGTPWTVPQSTWAEPPSMSCTAGRTASGVRYWICLLATPRPLPDHLSRRAEARSKE